MSAAQLYEKREGEEGNNDSKQRQQIYKCIRERRNDKCLFIQCLSLALCWHNAAGTSCTL